MNKIESIKGYLQKAKEEGLFVNTCERLLQIETDEELESEFKNIFPSSIYKMITSPVDQEEIPLFLHSDNATMQFTARYLLSR